MSFANFMATPTFADARAAVGGSPVDVDWWAHVHCAKQAPNITENITELLLKYYKNYKINTAVPVPQNNQRRVCPFDSISPPKLIAQIKQHFRRQTASIASTFLETACMVEVSIWNFLVRTCHLSSQRRFCNLSTSKLAFSMITCRVDYINWLLCLEITKK